MNFIHEFAKTNSDKANTSPYTKIEIPNNLRKGGKKECHFTCSVLDKYIGIKTPVQRNCITEQIIGSEI